MTTTIQSCFKQANWAVVGATQNVEKYGNKIFKKLRAYGYRVTPINPMYETVDSVRTIASVSELSNEVKVISIVVPPQRALQVIDELQSTGADYIWFQPGTYDETVIAKAEQSGLAVVYGYCVLVELNQQAKLAKRE